MRSFALCLSCLFLMLVSSSVFADVILKDGQVVAVGHSIVVIAGKIQIKDCETNKVSQYEQGIYQYKKGEDCKANPPKEEKPMKQPVQPRAQPQTP